MTKEKAKILGAFDALPFEEKRSPRPVGVTRQTINLAVASPGKWVVLELPRGMKSLLSRRSSMSVMSREMGIKIETKASADYSQLAVRVKL